MKVNKYFTIVCMEVLINSIACTMESNIEKSSNTINTINNSEAPCANQIHNNCIDLQPENDRLKEQLKKLQLQVSKLTSQLNDYDKSSQELAAKTYHKRLKNIYEKTRSKYCCNNSPNLPILDKIMGISHYAHYNDYSITPFKQLESDICQILSSLLQDNIFADYQYQNRYGRGFVTYGIANLNYYYSNLDDKRRSEQYLYCPKLNMIIDCENICTDKIQDAINVAVEYKEYCNKMLDQLPDWDTKSKEFKQKLTPYINNVEQLIRQLRLYKIIPSNLNLQENLSNINEYAGKLKDEISKIKKKISYTLHNNQEMSNLVQALSINYNTLRKKRYNVFSFADNALFKQLIEDI